MPRTTLGIYDYKHANVFESIKNININCRVRSCLRVTRYKIDLRKLLVFNEVCRGNRSTSGCFMGTRAICCYYLLGKGGYVFGSVG